ncbi:3-dehydroquinate synthase [Bacteroidales bacterium OttesenSCG-928-I21]|nr:3-dehydroquinate synthase [Bacteroidales bacterium OttesenSCG-928-I21]
MRKQKVIITNDIEKELSKILSEIHYSSIFILTDNTTKELCLPAIVQTKELQQAKIIEVKSGDENKNIEALSGIWKYLCENGATRKSLTINLGGGMITDLGGFAASTFKRGMDYINIPTTLLGAIDAAVGGKTGINFMGLKNEIGVINPAGYVLIDPGFFKTLDKNNFLSGYAEILKHSLIHSDEELTETLNFDLENIDYNELSRLLKRSVAIKEAIVEKDPKEQNIRKALNFGHTIGHAFESFSHETGKPVLHGYAVAYGIICELYLSCRKVNFPTDKLQQICRFLVNNYGHFQITCKHYERLYELMTHDKKNESKEINFTLLRNVGDICINQTANEKEIFDSLDFYRDFF